MDVPEMAENLTGFRCHIENCRRLVPGHVEELKRHFKIVHKLKINSYSDTLFKCSECGASYTYFTSLSRHLLSSHKEIAPIRMDEPAQAGTSFEMQPDADMEEIDIPIKEVPEVPNPDIVKSMLQTQAKEFVTMMRGDPSMPEAKVQNFMKITTKIMHLYQQYAAEVFKKFLNDKTIPETDEDVVQTLESMSIGHLFDEVATPDKNVSYLAVKAGTAVPVPREVVLGRRKVTQLANIPTQWGRKPKHIRKVRVQTDTAQYISVVDTLSLVVRSPAAREMISSEKQHEDCLTSFREGQQFQHHEVLKKYPHTVRLSLHLDDVEYANPLGSRRTKQKMTIISYKIENIHPSKNASPSRVYLALIARSADVKKYGYKAVLQPLLHDLQVLQAEQGVDVLVDDGSKYVLRAVLCHVVGDTLAMHEIFEMLSPSANLFCRACYITREQLHSGRLGNHYPPRTVDTVANELASSQGTRRTWQGSVKQECALNELPYFHFTTHNTFDPMHDLLEGVVKRVIGDIILLAVKTHKTVTIAQVNDAISSFDYGPLESSDKPSANFKIKQKGSFVNQSASQMWLLLRSFLFLFKDILTFGEQYPRLVAALLKITFYSFSDRLTLEQINDLEKEIDNFYDLFKKCFPDQKPINKMHHLSHYPAVIRQHGPVVHFSCMLFEMKFRESKSLSKTCNNFRNLAFSIAKRLNLRQIQSIINHSYEIGEVEVISSMVTSKVALDNADMFAELPDRVTYISHVKIDNTSFRIGSVARFSYNNDMIFGIIETMIMNENKVVCALNCLDVQYCELLNSYKAKVTGNIVRVSQSQLTTKKTYNFWKMTGEPDLYISLKYNDC